MKQSSCGAAISGIAMLCACLTPGLACEVVKSGIGGVELEREGRRASYRLAMGDPRWEISGFGWHANALVGCDGCDPAGVEGGIIWMDGVRAGSLPSQQEDEAFVGFVGAMWFSGGTGAVVAETEAEEFEWSGFRVRARRFVPASATAAAAGYVIAATVTDGCLLLRLYARSRGKAVGSVQAQLKALMTAVSIERTSE